MSNPYLEKNRGFLTSSKLKEFLRCAKCYYWKYELELPDPLAEFEEKDYFVIGQAVDDRLTHGEEYYKNKYMVVDRRMDYEEAKKDAEAKIEKGLGMLNKDGSQSATGFKMVNEAEEKLELLEKVKDKVQLTPAFAEQVEMIVNEFRANPIFYQKPTKKILQFEYAQVKFRCELDDFNTEKSLIVDLKTCANLMTFNPEFYTFQMSFYSWALEEVEGLKYEALLEVLDKYKYFSRSRGYLFTRGTLEANRGQILAAIEKYKEAKDLGLWVSDASDNMLLTCPYYGHEGHGRPTQPLIF